MVSSLRRQLVLLVSWALLLAIFQQPPACNALSLPDPRRTTRASSSSLAQQHTNNTTTRRHVLGQPILSLVALGTTIVTNPTSSIVLAYGEFEPGAKARKKASAEAKERGNTSSNNNSSPPPTIQIQSEDLKGALGEFSYSSVNTAPSTRGAPNKGGTGKK